MKIDFSNIQITGIEGEKIVVDVSKEIGNMLWCEARDIAIADLGHDIYHKKGVELTREQAQILKGYIEGNFKAILKRVLIPMLDEVG